MPRRHDDADVMQLAAVGADDRLDGAKRARFIVLHVWAKVVGPTRHWKVSLAPCWLYD